MTRVFWVRHGESVANRTGILSHRLFDCDLTDRGREEALALGRSLAGSGHVFTGLWASPLRRARQTAEILGHQLGMGLTGVVEELREVNVGELDGRGTAGAWATYDEIVAEWRRGVLDRRFPGGEDGHELAHRISSALHRLADDSAGPVLVVAHGSNLGAVLPTLTGQPVPRSGLTTATVVQLEVHPAAVHLHSWPAG
jgi:broad specificity phosphatase PhoE